MTDVRKDNTALIHSIEDAVPLYAGNGLPACRQTIGMETEISLYREMPDGTHAGASARECFDLLEPLRAEGQAPQLEMASALEYASPPFRITDLARMNRQVREDYAVFLGAIGKAGLKTGSSQLPFATLASARDNLVDRERARGLVEGMRRFKPEAFLKVTLLCTSTQVSISYADSRDLYRILATGYALSPVIFALFANHPAFIEGGRDVRAEHPRAVWYGQFGEVGGIPDSFLQATGGDDFIRRHAQQVFANNMLFYYDENGAVVWPESPLPFAALAERGLNTRSNYDLSESFLYHDLKVCNIRDETGAATGKRVEFRGFDGGPVSTLSAHAFVGLLLGDTETYDRLQGLLLAYGMTPDCEDFRDNLIASRHAAAHHGGAYMNVRYGRGRLDAFCRELAAVLLLAAERQPDAAAPLHPLIEIARTGQSLAKAAAAATPDYAAALQGLNTQSTVMSPRRQAPGRF